MKKPQDFPKAVALLQSVEIAMYTITAVVIYVYTGRDGASPALGSAGPIVSKIAYGIAIPTIVIAGVIFGHFSSKYVFVRVFNNRALPKRTWPVWTLIVGAVWTAAWIIAES